MLTRLRFPTGSHSYRSGSPKHVEERSTHRRSRLAAAIGLVLLASLSATPALAAATQKVFVRVVHGSPDAGPVTVSVDGAKLLTNFVYGSITPYVPIAAGPHKFTVTTASKATVSLAITLPSGSIKTSYFSIVATGELSPKASPRKPDIALTPFADQAFAPNSASVNFHHAARAAISQLVAFGYGELANPTDQLLGIAAFASQTNPIALPAKTRSVPIEFYAVSVKAVTLVPNQIDPNDFRNVVPSAAGQNLSAYAIDGPAAASVPTVAGSDLVRLIGIFDPSGT
jgi:hypothetical protein